MSVSLAKGGNVSLSSQAPGLSTVTVGLGWRAEAGYDLDASALLCGESGKVPSDEYFVFFNNLSSPDGSVRHAGAGSLAGGDDQQIHVDLARVPVHITKIAFPVSLYEGAVRGQSFGQVHRAHIRVLDQHGGSELARYDLTAGDLSSETALVFGELYRHGGQWKFRAVGQGYASGLAGIATDYGVDVLREERAPSPAPVASPPVSGGTYVPPTPAPGPTPTLVSPPAPAAPPQQHFGSVSMTCFFDPSHGPGMATVSWSPQWGVPRQIQACGACAQLVQTTPPPFYTPLQQGYPQYAPQGYPQGGYGQPYDDHHDHSQQGGGRRFGAGALIGAGAAGLVGGALLNEAFDDDEPDVVVNNYYED
ncbi:TerD family protein [Streptomyces sp. NPDC057403]|uniref:TerD family protein n=1 Tax=Streptomyces sp. NPDC057403 TaxID=3346119 RepID=UPI0036763CF4